TEPGRDLWVPAFVVGGRSENPLEGDVASAVDEGVARILLLLPEAAVPVAHPLPGGSGGGVYLVTVTEITLGPGCGGLQRQRDRLAQTSVAEVDELVEKLERFLPRDTTVGEEDALASAVLAVSGHDVTGARRALGRQRERRDPRGQ